MATTCVVHSYRGGTGKSTTTANLSVLLAALGKKVATIDLDITSPGLHVIYNVSTQTMKYTLNDYIYNRCAFEDIVLDLTNHLKLPRGSVYFLGSSMRPEEIVKIIREGYSEGFFHHVSKNLEEGYGVDYVIFDTHPGLNEDTLLAVMASDVSLLLMRMDKQDITGTYITSQILKKFGRLSYVILNMVPPNLAEAPDLPSEVSGIIEATVIGVLPFYEEVLSHRSRGVFCLHHPQHPYSSQMLKIAKKLLQLTSVEEMTIDLTKVKK
ncbi:MAG: MinD/ParA family protein [Candidatus Methanomethylicia archaeon]|jgi:MinD-like ATPase involved in chromosome partitioning or flagellar assembly|nr:MinD/ParA family protein [Candidatus Methanomethylicia archaeon]NHV59795.1 MinD/ParA family protein [Candidatus Verstraetearchaeota archaeon]